MTPPPAGPSRPAAQPPDPGGARPSHEPSGTRPPQEPGEAQPSRADRARDRDPAGRPRNARPRDALGRPLPRGAAGEERIPDDLAVPPAEALTMAQRLLDSGRPFHAHDVLEASWKAAPPADRELWRGLAQIAVGLTHARRGNAQGATALLRRGGQRVGAYAGADPHGIDAGEIARQASALADRIDAAGAAAAAADGPGIRLI